ncbi:MAG: hypothetical protein ACYDHY_09905 [Acidiferrobacterales bacterium]
MLDDDIGFPKQDHSRKEINSIIDRDAGGFMLLLSMVAFVVVPLAVGVFFFRGDLLSTLSSHASTPSVQRSAGISGKRTSVRNVMLPATNSGRGSLRSACPMTTIEAQSGNSSVPACPMPRIKRASEE